MLDKFNQLSRRNGAAAELPELLRFHQTFGDHNPLTDAINFVRERKRFYQFTRLPETFEIKLTDVKARLAQAEETNRNLGRNGPTISGPGITTEMQGNHFRELSMEIQLRVFNLRQLAELLKRQGDIPFQNLEAIKASSARIARLRLNARGEPVDQPFLQRIRDGGITRTEMRDHLARLREFSRFDSLYATPNSLEKFRWLLAHNPGEPANALLRELIRFHQTFGDHNPLTDAINFVRERKGFYRYTGLPETSPIVLADVEARLADGERAHDGLGRNGPTISGPGIDAEMQGNHFRELSMEIQLRNANLRTLVALLKRQTEIPFETVEQLEEAVLRLPEAALLAARPAAQAKPSKARGPLAALAAWCRRQSE